MRESDRTTSKRLAILLTALFVVSTLNLTGGQARANHGPYVIGDVFASVQNTTLGNTVRRYSPSGALLETLQTGTSTYTAAGSCFDGSGQLRVTNFQDNTLTLFGAPGTNTRTYPWVSGINASPESCRVENAPSGNVFVGVADGTGDVRKYAPGGGAPLATYNVATEDRGSDWVDLLPSDNCQLYYTSEGQLVKRFNVCTNTQMTDFVSLPAGSRCFAVRVRTDGHVFVACTDRVWHLDAAGVNVAPSPYLRSSLISPSFGTETGTLFAMNLDPDNATLWTGGLETGHIYRINIATGVQVTTFNGFQAGDSSLGGLTIFGEIGPPPPQPDEPISATGADITATEGAPFTGTVATFGDPAPMSTAAEYKATIDWGDSTPTSPGTITPPTGGSYTVSGTHTYTEEGSYKVTVTITDIDEPSNTATTTSTATVNDAELTATCATPPFSPQIFIGTTATFTDANTFAQNSDFSATINWGEGPTEPGTIDPLPTSGPGPYTVRGMHTYTSTGTFTITTTITDDGGSTATVKCDVLIFAFATGNGATFVIGDLEAGLTRHVTWWSSQWANINLMSGGAPPDAMKGFAGFEDNFLGLPPPDCGGTWSTDPGNSTPPPASVPKFMGVIVSSKVTKSGSVITGDIKQVVIVENDPGYQPSPGHPGTGTEIAILCSS
jgi:hypothetical protein